MFERFTDRARGVVVCAQEEARRLNHGYIGTEHLLLGLVREADGIAAQALGRLGLSLDVVRTRLEEIVGKGPSAPSGHMPFTPRAKKVLELSLREALQFGHDYIGTEHILLGIVREGEGVAAQILAQLGVDRSRVREGVIQLLSGNAPPAPSGPRTQRADTPAGAQAKEEARRLAGDGPVGTQHVLSAIMRDHSSLGATALAALGVTPDALEAELARLSPQGTSDEFPEEAGARRTRIEVRDDGVAVVLEDAALRDRLARALDDDAKVLRAGHPATATFPALWQDVTRHLADIAGRLDAQDADRWRPPEWASGPDVAAAYAVIHGAGGMRSILEVAGGVERNELRSALATWLIRNQPPDEGPVTYMAVLVRTSGGREWTYELSFGERPDGPSSPRHFLIAHALIDLTAEP